MKQRCHVALNTGRQRFYGVREEYRVTGVLLIALDQEMREHGWAMEPLQVPSTTPPFFHLRSDCFLGWLQWNINKMCVGFEMTYSLQPRQVVHWEHTRVMMMFLQCLLQGYGGQGNHLRRSNGLWLDRRVGRPPDGSDIAPIQEGMGMSLTLEQSGYAWIQDGKIDWDSMTFHPQHRAYIVFNTPSLQSTYVSQYWAVVRTKTDFLQFHDIFSRMKDLRSDLPQSSQLLQLLIHLCLEVFRKDLFQTLADLHVRQPLHPDGLAAGCRGEVPLTLQGFTQVFRDGFLKSDLHFVTGTKMKVTSIKVLFTWLWGWDGFQMRVAFTRAPATLRRVGPDRKKSYVLYEDMSKEEYISWWIQTQYASIEDQRKKIRWDGKRSSDAWKNFNQVAHHISGQPKVMCRRCGTVLPHPHEHSNGTNSMKRHYTGEKCRRAANNAAEQQSIQQSLAFAALEWACANGEEQTMELALRNLDHPNNAFYYGMAFYYAIKHGDKKLATHFLPELKKDPLQYEDWVLEALPEAAENGDESIIRLLIKEGALTEPDTRIGFALQKSARNGHLGIVQLLINGGADINDYEQFEDTALIAAAASGWNEQMFSNIIIAAVMLLIWLPATGTLIWLTP
ncbi:uncharacterized protein CDV56_100590 [Aspergillus thermomutatus]|uniref:BED-type domain-containing protein n=1 Tax=Aspergillus thermomutatus TaxID=41047 RepID=A0A397GKM4_ASPTH|nr:uncharacterized protein CDV56_100590 [Aspergillus thermomutatus]RHZ50298.1 hypothetical protein CDV56_100590 [Aspergillus thermomutatus]